MATPTARHPGHCQECGFLLTEDEKATGTICSYCVPLAPQRSVEVVAKKIFDEQNTFFTGSNDPGGVIHQST